MSYDSDPARACMNEDFPDPGGPYSKKPLRYGIPLFATPSYHLSIHFFFVKRENAPRSAYHSRLPRNARTSSTILSATPGASTTLRNGRLRRGKPNGRHSVPQAVCTTSRPSCPRSAESRASARSGANSARSRESVVSVTVSQGVPDAICIARVSRSRFTYKNHQK